jgi:succinoglycan biosynthesis transport protein ExoP
MLFRRKSKAVAPPPLPPAPAPATMPLAMTASEPDMRGLGSALWRKKTLILGITLLAAAGADLVVNSITPRFRSEARLLLEVR